MYICDKNMGQGKAKNTYLPENGNGMFDIKFGKFWHYYFTPENCILHKKKICLKFKYLIQMCLFLLTELK